MSQRLFSVTSIILATVSCIAVAASPTNLLTNGGFETTGRWAQEFLAAHSRHANLTDFDPLLPLQWNFQLNKGVIFESVSGQPGQDVHSGKLALKVVTPQNVGTQITMQAIEVVPGGTYTFGLWSKGSGKCSMQVGGIAFEGIQQLAGVEIKASEQWAQTTQTVTIPGHIRKVRVQVSFSGDCQMLLDDVMFGAELDEPFDVDAVLTTKLKADADTLMLIDFDGYGPQPKLESGATIIDGGRFGKCLHLDRKSMSIAHIPLSGKMPPEGTLEFWMSLDEVPQLASSTAGTQQAFMQLTSGGVDVFRFGGAWGNINASWRVTGGLYDPTPSISVPEYQGLRWFRKNQWNHIAMEWDQEAVRVYVNGVLVDYETGALPFYATPSTILCGPFWGGYSWSGTIDEVRLSKVKRYGPKIPSGVKWTSLAPAQKAAPAPLAVRKNDADMDQERAKLISPIPAAPQGVTTFDATQIKPLVDGDKTVVIKKDHPVAGMTTASVGKGFRLIRDPDFDGGYWKLSGIKPGRYYIGVWHGEAAWVSDACIYLNGRIVQCSTRSDRVQVVPGKMFFESQTAEAVELKDNDEIFILPQLGDKYEVVRLTLYPHPMQPPRGRNWESEQYEANWFRRGTNLGLSLDASFLAAEGKSIRDDGMREIQTTDLPSSLRMSADGKRAVAQCLINNPLPLTVQVEFTCVIKSYFRKTVGELRETITLEPHQQLRREIPFDVIADSSRYTIDAQIAAVNPPNVQATLGWPALDTANLFPGLRQNLPWPDPFVARDMRGLRFLSALPGERSEFALDGPWDASWTTALNPPIPAPSETKWQTMYMPPPYTSISFAKVDPTPHGLYLRRKFNIDAADVRRMHQLIITKVIDEGTVYINGKKMGNVRGTNTPLVCDITSALKAGENEIVVVLRDMLAIMNPAYINEQSPVASKDYLDAPGGVSIMGGLGIGKILVRTGPALAASNLLVSTSVQNKHITVRCELTNHTDVARKLRTKARVLDADTFVMDLESKDVELLPGQTLPLEFAKPWSNPVLWSPINPQLYTLEIETLDAATGKKLDLFRQRFGFRESWIDGEKIYFNGARVRLKGSTCQGGGIFQSDVQLQRGSNDLDFADEAGFLNTCYLGGVGNTPSKHNAERDVFWEVARKNSAIGASFYARHPSIIAWDLSNEWLSFLGHGSGDVQLAARQMHSMTKAVGEVDPTRWTFYNGDEDLHGLHNTFSTHYMIEASQGHPASGYAFHGKSAYYPDGAYFRPLDKEFKIGQEVVVNRHHGIKYKYGTKVLMNTENLWKVGGYMPPGPTVFMGEEDVLDYVFDSARGPIVWMWKQNLDAHRDLGVSSISSYCSLPGVARRAYMLQCFIMPEMTHHFFGGSQVSRTYSLHNDLFVPSKFSFQWELLDAQGKTVEKGVDERQMDSGDLQRGRMSFTLPRVASRTKMTLRLSLFADGKIAYQEDRDLEVWLDSAVPAGKIARQIALYDPKGETGKVLRRAGVAFESINFLTAPSGPCDGAALVIGEGAIDESTQADQERLSAYVQAGGRVLVLAQSPASGAQMGRALGNLPVSTTLETRQWSSMPWVRTPQHPVMAGISSWDLHFWSPDHVSARGAYTKPSAGPALTLVDSGGATGLEWVQLMEIFHGKGSYMLCQLPVAGSYDHEPMAREILARLVKYIGGESAFIQPLARLTVLTATNSPIADKLRDAGIVFDLAKTAASSELVPAPGCVTMVEGRDLLKLADKAVEMNQALAEGGILIVHDVWPSEQAVLNKMVGQEVKLTVQPLKMWEGRGYRNDFTKLTAGLSHLEFYWKRYSGAEADYRQAYDATLKIEDLVNWSAWCAQGIEHVYPGALLEIPVGKGKLIVDQLRWEIPSKPLAPQHTRVLTAMLMNLGVTVQPVVVKRTLPAGVKLQPVDIQAAANRSLRDDGKGGWTGQGPDADLRNLPTGPQNFGGVPFKVITEPNGCIALKSQPQPGGAGTADSSRESLPSSVVIPIAADGGAAGMEIEGLWFLHSGAFTGEALAGMYQVQYEDGSFVDIPLVGGINMRDWTAPPAQFIGERGTQSNVAWTGTTKTYSTVCLFRMLWVNPRPSSPVKAVRFSNPSPACPILIAMTAVVKSRPGGQAAAAQAAEIYGQAVKALRDGKDSQAEELLKQAVAADASHAGAWQALAQLYDKSKDENKAFEAYRAWAAAGATSPLPYNRIGQIYEARKQYDLAVEAYTQSLRVEWNQPPTLEAKARTEKLLNQK